MEHFEKNPAIFEKFRFFGHLSIYFSIRPSFCHLDILRKNGTFWEKSGYFWEKSGYFWEKSGAKKETLVDPLVKNPTDLDPFFARWASEKKMEKLLYQYWTRFSPAHTSVTGQHIIDIQIKCNVIVSPVKWQWVTLAGTQKMWKEKELGNCMPLDMPSNHSKCAHMQSWSHPGAHVQKVIICCSKSCSIKWYMLEKELNKKSHPGIFYPTDIHWYCQKVFLRNLQEALGQMASGKWFLHGSLPIPIVVKCFQKKIQKTSWFWLLGNAENPTDLKPCWSRAGLQVPDFTSLISALLTSSQLTRRSFQLFSGLLQNQIAVPKADLGAKATKRTLVKVFKSNLERKMESTRNKNSHQKLIAATLARPVQCDMQAASCNYYTHCWNI